MPVPLASWLSRAGALGLDVLPGAAVLATATLIALSVPLRGGWWWACVGLGSAAVLWTGFNRLLLPGASGQSVGRRTFGTTLVRHDDSVVGPATLLVRDTAHLLDTAPAFLGWLWPLKDARRRTLADVMTGTEVRVASSPEAPRGARRRAGIVALAAAAVCAAGAIASVTVVARQDASVTDTSAAITAQGPHIVEQILSYYPDTLQADFGRAQSLVTDAYRGQLTHQQQTVRKAGAVRNEYWVTNSSVLDAAHGRATMLLFLQGQRGAAPDQRYLSATVRVKFVQSGPGTWQVDNLTVVTSPQPIEAKP
ncbi:RDD family protein [Mycobacterium hodleri]|uniref:RDD family protein n=1 Tax=Mycolicibacterium hodleri TaxID=49897 RepID=A0A544VWJ9_9MYCO|nr:RDD family protein [Mycolicibacterium hodleri]TQR84358.1 RDD family protein [Mycolicibacterium hodleri]